MAKPVVFKLGQYLLLALSLLLIGAAGGMFAVAIHWRIHGALLVAIPVEIVGIAAFCVLSLWKTLEARAPGKPLYF
jgi:hypothetical protein